MVFRGRNRSGEAPTPSGQAVGTAVVDEPPEQTVFDFFGIATVTLDDQTKKYLYGSGLEIGEYTVRAAPNVLRTRTTISSNTQLPFKGNVVVEVDCLYCGQSRVRKTYYINQPASIIERDRRNDSSFRCEMCNAVTSSTVGKLADYVDTCQARRAAIVQAFVGQGQVEPTFDKRVVKHPGICAPVNSSWPGWFPNWIDQTGSAQALQQHQTFANELGVEFRVEEGFLIYCQIPTWDNLFFIRGFIDLERAQELLQKYRAHQDIQQAHQKSRSKP